jgi:hypothetical protein
LLIENKIHAAFQPTQAERYQIRGAQYIKRKRCESFVTLLVAPEAYFGSDSDDTKGFDAKLTYESVMAWFNESGLGPRAAYKMALLNRAIEKAKFGYQPTEDAAVTEFWHSYWRLGQAEAPELEMQDPGPKPAGSGFVYFRPGNMPPNTCIIHKFERGNVDLQIGGMGDDLESLRSRFASRLEPDMSLQRASKSGVVRVKVPVVHPSQGMQSQLDEVRVGLKEAVRLLRWYRECQESTTTK